MNENIPADLREGDRLAGIPAPHINAGLEARRDQLRGGPFRYPADLPVAGSRSSGPSAEPLVTVLVYDDLVGGSWSAGRYQPATARGHLAVWDGTAWEADQTGAFVTCVPRSTVEYPMSTSGCDCGSSSLPAGISIDTPIGADGDNRVYDNDGQSGAVTVTGRGVAAAASVTVTITDGSTSLTPTVTNNGDGTWTAASQSLSTLSRGLVRVTATDGATTESVALMYAKADSTSALNDAPPRPNAPDLQAASDTGTSSTDNATDDTTPTVDVTTTQSGDTLGPVPVLIVDGVAVGTVETRNVNYFTNPPGGNGLTGPLTPSTALTEADHTIQVQLFTDDATNAESGTSEPLRVSISSASGGATVAKRYHQAFTASKSGETYILEMPLGCPIENSEALNTRLDA